ncbi:MAG: hypothetical protein INR73_20310 [Williamsia sp.]|nr:hypothetical protein [Williamsia sp.]
MQYTSSKNFYIDELLDSTQCNFEQFVPAIDSTTPEEAAHQMVRYSYYAALTVQKDFGTSQLAVKSQ